MKLSVEWVKEFVNLEGITAQKLADVLTMKTCEVEEIEKPFEFLELVQVAKIESIEKHPDANKLQILQLECGSKKLQVVTAAKNVEVGGYYALALENCELPSGMVIKKSKLRGIESQGMLCSTAELNLDGFALKDWLQPEDGVWQLSKDLTTATPLATLLEINETILDIDNKSITHRPDLWCHYGFAREIASLLNRPLQPQPGGEAGAIEKEYFQINEDELPQITITEKSAIAYSGTIIKNVKVTSSAVKIQSRLALCGMRPLNNIVDASNYILLELGQPNHAFDKSFIGTSITVEKAKQGEVITTLDGEEHKLSNNIVLIKSNTKAVAIAGIMGGLNSEVKQDTKEIFFESASFYRSDIRKAVSELNIRSESSQRFEKGQTPEKIANSINRFFEILQQSNDDLIISTTKLVEQEKTKYNKIETTYSYLLQRLGSLDLTKERLAEILQSQGMQVTFNKDHISVDVPSYRSYFDLTIAEDLVEEIGRVIGYKEIERVPKQVSCEVPQFVNHTRFLEHKIRNIISQRYNYQEVYNYCFQSQAEIDLDKRFSYNAIQMANSIQHDLPFMRISPLPALLKNVKNLYKANEEIKFFEIEKIFLTNEKSNVTDQTQEQTGLPQEKEFVAAVWYSQDKENVTKILETVIAQLTDLLEQIGLPKKLQQQQRISQSDIFHLGRSGEIINQLNNNSIFRFGQINPRICDELKLPREVIYFEALLEDLCQIDSNISYYQPVTKYPSAEFEFTMVCDNQLDFLEIKNQLKVKTPSSTAKQSDTFVESFDFLTSYNGTPIPEGKKSVSCKLVWKNNQRTLEHDEIKRLQENIINKINKKGFELRS